ncbi:hypothetical protein [Umezawaea sp.]|uniref:hypothetical protein n=1 Tax=Umezawaea sp. TaxID=1955258 RepID=UPI002ED2F830
MAVAVRVLVALSVIAQVAAVAAARHADAAYRDGRYEELSRTSLVSLAALAVLALVGLTTSAVSAFWLWEERGRWAWLCWAAGPLCLAAQGFAFFGQRTVVYLVLLVLHVVSGLALAAAFRPPAARSS